MSPRVVVSVSVKASSRLAHSRSRRAAFMRRTAPGAIPGSSTTTVYLTKQGPCYTDHLRVTVPDRSMLKAMPPAVAGARRLGLLPLRGTGLAKGRRHASRAVQRPAHASSNAGGGSHVRWLEEVAMLQAPNKIQAMLKVLHAQGHEVVGPATRTNLHPLLIPLSTGKPVLQPMLETRDRSTTDNQVYVCLLTWPCPQEHQGMELPVVSMSPGAPSVRLLARSVDEYLHRVLATEDAAGHEKTLAEAAGEMGSALYQIGSVAPFGIEKLDAYLTTKAGIYCDVAEKLVQNHITKGDEMSSLITGEWYMRKHFNGWARPFEFNAQHMLRCGHNEEARDTARMALRMPWWSLQEGYSDMNKLADISGSPRQVFGALNDEGGVEGPVQQSVVAGRSDQETAFLEADLLMNLVAADGGGDWDGIRGELSGFYKRAGASNTAAMLEAISS